MKKLILASAIAAAALTGTASAADVLKKDALTLNLSGEYEVQLGQAIGDDQDVELVYDDLELGLGAEYAINGYVTAFGNVVLNWADQAEDGSDDSTISEAYVGLKTGHLSTSVGRQYFGSDDFGIEKAYKYDGGTAFPIGSGSDTIKFDYAAGQYNAVLSHDIDEGDADDGTATDLFLTTTAGRFDLGLAYQNYDANDGSDDIETYGVMASAKLGKANVGIDYSTNDDFEYTNVAVGFPIKGRTAGSVGMTFESPEGGRNVDHWYANATHQLNNNVSVYGEIGDNDMSNTDLGFVTGMKVTF